MSRLRPLDSDGPDLQLLRHLCLPRLGPDGRAVDTPPATFSFRLPSTVVLRGSRPVAWYDSAVAADADADTAASSASSTGIGRGSVATPSYRLCQRPACDLASSVVYAELSRSSNNNSSSNCSSSSNNNGSARRRRRLQSVGGGSSGADDAVCCVFTPCGGDGGRGDSRRRRHLTRHELKALLREGDEAEAARRVTGDGCGDEEAPAQHLRGCSGFLQGSPPCWAEDDDEVTGVWSAAMQVAVVRGGGDGRLPERLARRGTSLRARVACALAEVVAHAACADPTLTITRLAAAFRRGGGGGVGGGVGGRDCLYLMHTVSVRVAEAAVRRPLCLSEPRGCAKPQRTQTPFAVRGNAAGVSGSGGNRGEEAAAAAAAAAGEAWFERVFGRSVDAETRFLLEPAFSAAAAIDDALYKVSGSLCRRTQGVLRRRRQDEEGEEGGGEGEEGGTVAQAAGRSPEAVVTVAVSGRFADLLPSRATEGVLYRLSAAERAYEGGDEGKTAAATRNRHSPPPFDGFDAVLQGLSFTPTVLSAEAAAAAAARSFKSRRAGGTRSTRADVCYNASPSAAVVNLAALGGAPCRALLEAHRPLFRAVLAQRLHAALHSASPRAALLRAVALRGAAGCSGTGGGEGSKGGRCGNDADDGAHFAVDTAALSRWADDGGSGDTRVL